MTPAAFFAALWPKTGNYCLASLDHNSVLRHHWYATPDQAGEAALRLDEAGRTVYHACASFKETNSRKKENAHASRAVWVDLDVGEGPLKYPNVSMAAAGLRQFLDTTELPNPTMLVYSGGGMHAYWCFENDVAVPLWHNTASLFKRVAAHHKFLIDPTRTADISSILRPIGTHNWKYDPPREVRFIIGADTLPFANFAAQVGLLAADMPPPAINGTARHRPSGINARFTVEPEYDPTDANLVADKCAQVRWFRDSKGNLPEPVWYAAIGVVAKCENGREITHEWSSGFASYSAKETDTKLRQVENVGPTTCAHFASINPGGCAGCPHAGNIVSPIRLGVRLSPSAIAIPPVDVFAGSGGTDAPLKTDRYTIKGYGYTKSGMVYEQKDKPPITFYPYDIYVQEIAYDDTLQFEVAVVKHWLPQEGWKEFPIRSSVVSSDEKCETALRDNHVKPWHSKVMRSYLIRCMEHVQRQNRMRKLYGSLGWKDGTDFFVLGDIAYYKDGRQEPVGLSPTIAGVAQGVHSKGTVDAWVGATEMLNRPGMEAHALVWAVGPGAPLMKFTGFEGALINAVGPSSSGKTSMARFALSMYGDFDKLKLKQRDTVNAKIQRIAVLGSLPAYVDEITNENPQEVSDFIYEITQGRSKLRLKVDGSERLTQAWNTVVLSSSNTSLSNKLGLAKANPEAERLRLFELTVAKRGEFDDLTGRELKHVLDENYGAVGAEYIAYVVEHQDRIRHELGVFMDQFRVATKARTEERMWVASLCCCLYGTKLMHDMGLTRVDVKRLIQYAVTIVAKRRLDMDESKYDPVTLLGLYMNEFASYRLTVVEQANSARGKNPDYILKRAPVGELRMRYDMTQNLMWIDRRHFRDWLAKHHENYNDTRDYLIREGVVLGEVGKTLGTGTEVASSNIPCVQINMLATALGNIAATAASSVNVIPIRHNG